MTGSARLRELLDATQPDLTGDEDDRFFNVMDAEQAHGRLAALAPELARIVIDLLDNVAICTNDIPHTGRDFRPLPCRPDSPCDACQLRARVEALL